MIKETLVRTGRYWRLLRKYNTLENNYETLQKEDEYKDRIITRQKNEIKKKKKKLKKRQQTRRKPKKKRQHITSVRKKKKI